MLPNPRSKRSLLRIAAINKSSSALLPPVITNKNLIPADGAKDWDRPSGLRMGTIEITRLGMREEDMVTIADFVARVLVQGEVFYPSPSRVSVFGPHNTVTAIATTTHNRMTLNSARCVRSKSSPTKLTMKWTSTAVNVLRRLLL